MLLHPTPTAWGIPAQPMCLEDAHLRFVETMETEFPFYSAITKDVFNNRKGIPSHPINSFLRCHFKKAKELPARDAVTSELGFVRRPS